MKLKNILILGSLVTSISLTTSCDDQLSALPTQSKVDGNVVVDQKSALAALNGIYYRYAQCGVDNYNILSTQCANIYEIYPANVAGIITYYQGPFMFETHGNLYYSYYSSYIWNPYYETMSTINSVIKQVGDAPASWFSDNIQTEILAEAHCMRAMVNYDLLRYFGYFWDINSRYGNILRSEPSTSKNLSIPRSNVKDTYKQILEDLEYAITNGKEESENYNANVWVAKGQKVRILMMRGEEGDYESAAALAQDIIDNSPYELEAHTTNIFHTKGLGSKEVMFGIKPQTKSGQQTAVMEAYYYRGTPQWNYTSTFEQLFENDPRKDELIGHVEAQTIVYDYDDNGNYMGYHWETVKMGVVCKHFPMHSIIANEVEESQYMMRLGEMYMLCAEALVRANGNAGLSKAKDLVRTVMERAGITDFTELDAVNDEHSFMQVYFNEYLKNFFCESGREWDIMFRMPKDIVYAFNPEYYQTIYDDEGKFVSIGEPNFGMSIFGLPSDEFKNNYSLTTEDQNPGYSTASTL